MTMLSVCTWKHCCPRKFWRLGSSASCTRVVKKGWQVESRELTGIYLDCPETTVCSDGTSSFHKTASHSPDSPLYPAEPDNTDRVLKGALG